MKSNTSSAKFEFMPKILHARSEAQEEIFQNPSSDNVAWVFRFDSESANEEVEDLML